MRYKHKHLPWFAKPIEWEENFYNIFKTSLDGTSIAHGSKWEIAHPEREIVYAINKELIEDSSDWEEWEERPRRIEELITELDSYNAFKIRENCRQEKFQEALDKYIPKITRSEIEEIERWDKDLEGYFVNVWDLIRMLKDMWLYKE